MSSWRTVAFASLMLMSPSGCVSAPEEGGEAVLALAERLSRPSPEMHALIVSPISDWHRAGERWSSEGTALAVDAPTDAGSAWRLRSAAGPELSFRVSSAVGTAEPVGGALVYADVDGGALLAAATSRLVEIFFLVTEASSARRWEITFDAAAITAEGSAFVIRGHHGATFRLTAPSALDAEGRRLPVLLSQVAPGTLTLQVTGDVALPLLVDPIIEIVEWRNLQANTLPVRTNHAAVFDESRGVTFVYGGSGPGSTPRSDAWTWDGASWSAVPGVSPSPSDRFDHAMAYVGSSALTLLFGGVSAGRSSDETWVWDGASWTLRSPSSRPPARRSHALAYDPVRDRVVLFGGTASPLMPLRDTWEWDGTVWRELTPARSPEARSLHAMAFEPESGHVLIHGGLNAAGETLEDVWEWDGGSWARRDTTGAPAAYGHTLSPDPVGGGLIATGGDSLAGPVSQTRRLLGTSWAVEAAGDLPRLRVDHTVVVDTRQSRLLLVGGLAVPTSTRLGGLLMWSGREWIPQTLETSPPRRAAASLAAATSRDRLVLFGGLSGTGYLDDTWELHGSDWRALSPTRRPPARSLAALWHDEDRGRTYLFGGFAGATGSLSDFWAWDGVDWSPVVAAGPTARSGHAVAYDRMRRQSVLFGGSVLTGTRDSTWTWDGTNWSEVTGGSRPSARRSHAMAYDAERHVVVLFGGGEVGGSAVFADTWEWDGASWRDTGATGPSARVGHVMTFVPERHAVVLFGGYDPRSGFLNDNWEWDGTGWYDVTTRGTPPARADTSLAYQADMRRAILFGGTSGSGQSDETWAYSSYRALDSDCDRDEQCGSRVCELGVCVPARSDAGSLDASALLDATPRDSGSTPDGQSDDGGRMDVGGREDTSPTSDATAMQDSTADPDAAGIARDAAGGFDGGGAVETPAPGCGCRAGTSRPRTGWLGAVALALFTWARRRSRLGRRRANACSFEM